MDLETILAKAPKRKLKVDIPPFERIFLEFFTSSLNDFDNLSLAQAVAKDYQMERKNRRKKDNNYTEVSIAVDIYKNLVDYSLIKYANSIDDLKGLIALQETYPNNSLVRRMIRQGENIDYIFDKMEFKGKAQQRVNEISEWINYLSKEANVFDYDVAGFKDIVMELRDLRCEYYGYIKMPKKIGKKIKIIINRTIIGIDERISETQNQISDFEKGNPVSKFISAINIFSENSLYNLKQYLTSANEYRTYVSQIQYVS